MKVTKLTEWVNSNSANYYYMVVGGASIQITGEMFRELLHLAKQRGAKPKLEVVNGRSNIVYNLR